MKLIIKIAVQIVIFFGCLCAQSDYEEWLKKDEQTFAEYEASITAEYEKYELEDKQAFEKFKREVEEKWEEFKSPTKKEYVEYDDKKESRTSIDFEKGTITVEVLLEEGESAEKAQQKLKEVTEKIVKSKGEDDKPLLENQLESPKKEKVTPANIQQLSSELIKKDKIQVEKNH